MKRFVDSFRNRGIPTAEGTLHPHPGSFSLLSSLTLDCIAEDGDATTVLRRDMTTRSRSLSDPASRHSTHEGSSCQLPIKPVIRKRKEV